MEAKIYLEKEKIEKKSPRGKNYFCIKNAAISKLSLESGLTKKDLEIIALKNDIIPERYERNMGTIGKEGQIKLLDSKVSVVGSGGLGGYIIELLARMGIGELKIFDGDTFDDNNLNRQILLVESDIGKEKVKSAAERVKEINSAVKVESYNSYIDEDNSIEMFKGSDVVVDALDNIKSRFIVEKACKDLKIPMVHGAIGGYYGQVMTVFPEDDGLKIIYGNEENASNKGLETEMGNPAATPAMIAAWQVQEVIKILTKKGTLLRNRMIYMDAIDGEVQVLEF